MAIGFGREKSTNIMKIKEDQTIPDTREFPTKIV